MKIYAKKVKNRNGVKHHENAIQLLPGMVSFTILPLHQSGFRIDQLEYARFLSYLYD